MKNSQFRCLLLNHHLPLLPQIQVVRQNQKVNQIKYDIIKLKEKIMLFQKKIHQFDHALIVVVAKRIKERFIHILNKNNLTTINQTDSF